MSDTDSVELAKYIVTIRAYGPAEAPGEARYDQYEVAASDSDDAKEKAVNEAKGGFNSLIGRSDSYDIIEVSGPHG